MILSGKIGKQINKNPKKLEVTGKSKQVNIRYRLAKRSVKSTSVPKSHLTKSLLPLSLAIC